MTTDDLDALLLECVADDPVAPLAVDITVAGLARQAADRAEEVDLSEEETAALAHGLALLADRGDAGAAALLGTWPAPGAPGALEPVETGTRDIALRLSPAIGASLAARVAADAVERQRDGSVLWSARMTEGDVLPWLLRLGPRAEILSPRALRADLVDRAATLAERYRRPPPRVTPAAPGTLT